MTFVHVTHSQEEAMALADLVVVMNHGRIEQAGTPHEVFNAAGAPSSSRASWAATTCSTRRGGHGRGAHRPACSSRRRRRRGGAGAARPP